MEHLPSLLLFLDDAGSITSILLQDLSGGYSWSLYNGVFIDFICWHENWPRHGVDWLISLRETTRAYHSKHDFRELGFSKIIMSTALR